MNKPVFKHDRDQFIETNLPLLYKFMAAQYLSNEYLGPLTERYIKTADRYLKEDRLQQYAFSTVLWLNLRSELHELQRKLKENSTLISLEDVCSQLSTTDDHSGILLWSVLENELTSIQLKTLQLRLEGQTNREIAHLYQVTEKAIERRFFRIRKKFAILGSKSDHCYP